MRLRVLAVNRGLNVIETSARTLMMVSAGVDKARGILEACGELGLRREEVAVIGDDRNDLPCFQTFPYSFCMAGAEREIRKQARWTVESAAEALSGWRTSIASESGLQAAEGIVSRYCHYAPFVFDSVFCKRHRTLPLQANSVKYRLSSSRRTLIMKNRERGWQK